MVDLEIEKKKQIKSENTELKMNWLQIFSCSVENWALF